MKKMFYLTIGLIIIFAGCTVGSFVPGSSSHDVDDNRSDDGIIIYNEPVHDDPVYSATGFSGSNLSATTRLDTVTGGDWAITVEGVNLTGTVPGTGSSTMDIIGDGSTATVTAIPSAVITTSPVGTDKLLLSIDWDNLDEFGTVCRLTLVVKVGSIFKLGTVSFDEIQPVINVRQDTTVIENGGTYDFGYSVGGQSLQKTFTIENTGNAELNLTGDPKVSISGYDDSMFNVDTQPSSPVGESQSTIFTITFNPEGEGEKYTCVSIFNDDADENPYTFMIKGTVPTPEINIKQGENDIPLGTQGYDFGDIQVDSKSDAIEFIIENTGTLDLMISGNITIDNATDFSITQPSSPIEPGNNTTFTIIFSPTSTGSKTAIVTINNNDSDENPFEFSVIGNGVMWKSISSPASNIEEIVSIDDTLFVHTPKKIYRIDFDNLVGSWEEIHKAYRYIKDIDVDSGNLYVADAWCIKYSTNKGDTFSRHHNYGWDSVTGFDFKDGIGWEHRGNWGYKSGTWRYNGGWTFVNSSPRYYNSYDRPVNADVLDPTNIAYVYSYKLTNGGSSCTSISYPVLLSDAIGDTPYIYSNNKYSSNRGSTWNDIGISAYAYDKDQATNQLFAAKSNGNKGVYVKNSGAWTWTQYGTKLENMVISDIHVYDDAGEDNYLFAITSTGEIYYCKIK